MKAYSRLIFTAVLICVIFICYSQNLESHIRYYDPYTKTKPIEKYYTISGSNKKQGDYKTWTQNGILTSVTPYTNGKINGVLKTFNEYSGKLESEILYKEGKIMTEKYYLLENSIISVDRYKGYTIYDKGIVEIRYILKPGKEFTYTSTDEGELSWGYNEYMPKNFGIIRDTLASEIIAYYLNGKLYARNVFGQDGFSTSYEHYNEKGLLIETRTLIDVSNMKYQIDSYENGKVVNTEYVTAAEYKY